MWLLVNGCLCYIPPSCYQLYANFCSMISLLHFSPNTKLQRGWAMLLGKLLSLHVFRFKIWLRPGQLVVELKLKTQMSFSSEGNRT